MVIWSWDPREAASAEPQLGAGRLAMHRKQPQCTSGAPVDPLQRWYRCATCALPDRNPHRSAPPAPPSPLACSCHASTPLTPTRPIATASSPAPRRASGAPSAERLVADGWTVTVLVRRDEAPTGAQVVIGDAAATADLQRAIDAATGPDGRLHGLVCAAGLPPTGHGMTPTTGRTCSGST